MELRDEVQSALEALCEGNGVTVDEDGDFCVALHACPVWVRVDGDCGWVTLFSSIAFDVPFSRAVAECCNTTTSRVFLFRLFWEDEQLVLRADILADPFVASHLRRALDDFQQVAVEVLSLLGRRRARPT